MVGVSHVTFGSGSAVKKVARLGHRVGRSTKSIVEVEKTLVCRFVRGIVGA